jgi:hypothetical protein
LKLQEGMGKWGVGKKGRGQGQQQPGFTRPAAARQPHAVCLPACLPGAHAQDVPPGPKGARLDRSSCAPACVRACVRGAGTAQSSLALPGPPARAEPRRLCAGAGPREGGACCCHATPGRRERRRLVAILGGGRLRAGE